ncbi:tRNA lysidine(34) synthetase TilS [Fulvivirga sediminis]|uniref:tRNA(Ile)-lysidine synthase n=1 Tax=Fulvivirga sediminis TaxID=2803949 RepID=A0A937F796_9BACT|nr:tRNA lysidine(34) synthetase TilS [Fulvivirga sediminis]MBL3656332.1 tRNA lysidine(34) synthetase TilS [Fulvivirga sediminis]
MVKKFLDFIDDNNLCKYSDRLLVAVSGGVDSMVLATLLKQSKYSFTIAHCNFNLRGAASDEDEVFVKKFAKSIKVDCITESFNTKDYAENKGVSIEMAARELRYQWFDKLLAEKGLKYLVTAHHLNDSLETTLYNLAKGTGISGLRGIRVKNNRLIRPLLWATKDEILCFASQNKIQWRDDVSNFSDDYMRNKIRNNVVPELRKINPSVETTFVNTQKRLLEMEQMLHELRDDFKNQYWEQRGNDHYLSLDRLRQVDKVVLLEELLRPFGFSYIQSEEVMRAVKIAEPGKLFFSASHQVNVDRDSLIISERVNGKVEFEIHEEDELVQHGGVTFKLSLSDDIGKIFKSAYAVSLDYDRLEFPLKVRKWQLGDAFRPLGMRGKKKLSDFMIDEKIPLNLKERVYVLTSGEDIAWVIGYRIDDRYKITSSSQKIFNIVRIDNE